MKTGHDKKLRVLSHDSGEFFVLRKKVTNSKERCVGSTIYKTNWL